MVLISEDKALFLGVPLNKRKDLTVEELTKFELDSGFYVLRNGKTFITDEGREQRGKGPRQLRLEAERKGINVETGEQVFSEKFTGEEKVKDPFADEVEHQELTEAEEQLPAIGPAVDALLEENAQIQRDIARQIELRNLGIQKTKEEMAEAQELFLKAQKRSEEERKGESVFSAGNIKRTLQSLGLAFGPAVISAVLTTVGSITGAGVSAVGTTKVGAGLASGLGIAGLSIPEASAKLAVKGAMGIAGFDGIMVWMASDNVLTGTAFTMKKLRESVKAGILTRREADKEIKLVQEWIDAARNTVEVSVAVNPFIMPFRRILLINADKSQKDFDLEVELIDVEFEKLKGGK